MTTYRPEPFFNIKSALLIVGFCAIMGLFPVFDDSPYALQIFIAIGMGVVALRQAAKKIFYNGQFGKTLTTEADKFSIDNNGDLKIYNYKDVSEFGRYYVNKQGFKFHIKVNGEEIKFFTPDARKIEKEFLELMASHGKSLEKKGSFFPSGTTYIVVGNAPEGKVKRLYCKKCNAEVDDDMLKCQNCHRLLSLDNAVVEKWEE